MYVYHKNSRCLIACLLWALSIFSLPAQAVTEQIRISSTNDDVEERITDGDMYRDSTDLEFGFDDFVDGLQIVGLRFQNVNIPQGATINSAYIVFETDESDSGATTLVIFGEDTDSANQFSSVAYNISNNRAKTSAAVNWTPSAWNTISALHQTPDLSRIIQEIVDRAGWLANNNLVLIVEPGSGCLTTTCQRTAESYDGERNNGPLLVVDYTPKPIELSVYTEDVIGEYGVSSYGGSSQDRTGAVEIRDAGLGLYMDGNRWQKIDFPYTVTVDTVIEFDFQSTVEGEIHGLGFDNDLDLSSDKSFRVHGTQNFGISNFATYTGNGTTHFTIPVGEFYTGNFQYLFFINDDDRRQRADSFFSNIVVYEKTNLLVEYHFDELSWGGNSGEVLDNLSNGLNGTAIGNSTTINDGQVCRAGTFDGSGDYVEAPGIDEYLSTTASLSFWINTLQIGNNTAWNAPGIAGVEEVGGGNDIFWGYIDASGHIRIQKGNGRSAVSNQPINNGSWHHVVLTWDSSTGVVQVFVDGNLDNSATSETGDVSTAFSSIGLIKNNGVNFNGQLDELLVFGSVLSLNDVRTIYDNQFTGEKNYNGSPRTCPEPVVHHYEIVHDGQGLTCAEEFVTVKACIDESCSSLSAVSVSLDFLADGDIISSPTFSGSARIDFSYTSVETLTFSIANASVTSSNPFVCDDGVGSSCDMAFSNVGFRFLYGDDNRLTLTNQISGSVFDDTLKLQAVKDTLGVCTGLFNDDVSVALSQENIDPVGTSGLSFTTNNRIIAKHPNTTPTTLQFTGDSIAVIPMPIYHDAGQIRLHASYILGESTVLGTSNTFWVSPAKLIVSAKAGTTDINGATSTATKVHPAGANFELSVKPFNSLDVITPNYSPGQIQIKLSRTGPTVGVSADGNFNYATTGLLKAYLNPEFENVTLSDFSSGVSTYSEAQYSEVGLLNLAVKDSNYGNANITVLADAIDIGRFIPDHFIQTIAEDGYFLATCNSGTTFAYSGQKDEATNTIGAITYLTNPTLAITAYNQQGQITQNYTDSYMKLSNTGVSITEPTLDQVVIGADSTKLLLTANMNTGILSQNDLTTLIPEDNPLPKGVLHYQLSNSDNFFYDRSANALVAPFTADIDFSIASITDSDNVNVITTADASPVGVEIRFGRLSLVNSFGPETANLNQLINSEHFDGTTFITTTDNNCVTYNADKISLSNISLDPALTRAEGQGVFMTGKARDIKLTAPGSGKQGEIGVLYDSYDWLKYDWDNDGEYDDNPTAVATFGVFRGNDRVISWREVIN
jgi:MSHA biogenesis protein MshQ